MDLPKYIHRRVKNGRVSYHFQKNRGTAYAGPRTRIPFAPDDPRFWETYKRLLDGKSISDWSVAALVRDYRASMAFKGLKEATRRDYDRYLTEFEKRLGSYPAKAITTAVMAELHESMAATPVAANHMRSVIKTLYLWGIPREYASINPCDNLRPHKIESDGAKPWPSWAFDLIAQHARWEVRTFVALGLYTGQRTKDILAMRLSDIDGDMIAVRQSKTGKPLMIPIHRDLSPVIAEVRRRGFIQLVPGPKGDALDTNRWRALWGREIAKAELKRIRDASLSPHGLRKTACVTLRALNLSVEQIQSITGQSRQMVDHYCRDYDQAGMARQVVKRWEEGVQTPVQTGRK